MTLLNLEEFSWKTIPHKTKWSISFFKIFSDCVVKDANSNQEYSVIENQCTDVFVNTEMSPAFSSDAVNFSYTAFQFVANSDVTEALSMRLVCSVRPIFIPMTSWWHNDDVMMTLRWRNSIFRHMCAMKPIRILCVNLAVKQEKDVQLTLLKRNITWPSIWICKNEVTGGHSRSNETKILNSCLLKRSKWARVI